MKHIWKKAISLMLSVALLITMPTITFANNQFIDKPSKGYESSNYMALATPSQTMQPQSKTGLVLDGTQSSWAESELKSAYNYGLTYPDVMKDFKKSITREEFCTIIVKLYENLTGKTAEAGTDPFNDTNNPEILKAYKLKIVNGTSQDTFSPANNITRQEICVMIFRALDVSIASLDKTTADQFPFADSKKIASWAIEAMKFAYKNQIMKGVGNNQIAPLNNTTREEAIVLLKRTYVKYSGTEEVTATIPIQSGSPPMTNEQAKFNAIEPGKNLAFLGYDERIKLFVSTTANKPSSLPISSQSDNTSPLSGELDLPRLVAGLTFTPTTTIDLTKDLTKDLSDGLSNLQSIDNKQVYIHGSYSAFIDTSESKKRWFAYKLSNASGAKKIVWQVSKSPFNGFAANWKTPLGLVGSGEVSASKGEFQIDFGNLKISASNSFYTNSNVISNLTSSFKPIPQKRCTYYVRAVPVDSAGNAIGDPGEGIAVIYGERVVAGNPNASVIPSFELWTPALSSLGKYYGENQDKPVHKTTVGISPNYNEDRVFHFHGLEDTCEQIVFQVSTEPFPANGGGWPDTPNIIYEKNCDLPTTTFTDIGRGSDNEYPASVLVNFTEFGKPASEMKEGEYIKYYARGVALKKSIEPGQYDVIYSDTITVEYGFSPPIKWFSDSPYDKWQKLNVSKPNIKIKSYTPVDWQDPDYMHHYYVFKQPTADDIKCKWKNTNTGEVLYPYIYPYITYYTAKGINSKAQYEAEAIPKVLQTGTKVYFPPPKEEDKPWYEELFDGIVNFFDDLWGAVQTIVNQVSAAYNNLKIGLINFVVDLCPVDSLKDKFKLALEGLVNYGLMSIGIPPTLPNFDQLSDMSMNYLAEVALTEAGIPPNKMTQELVSEVAESIQNEIESAVNYADANPINAGFLKLDPDYLYRPAYVDVEIYNSTAVSSIAGSFNMNVTFEMDYYNKLDPAYGLALSVPTNYSYNSDAGIVTAAEYRNHFEYGLNGNTVNYAQGGEAVYDVFEPKVGIKVPILSSGEHRIVRVYLEPFNEGCFTRYPGGSYVLPIDFENIYFRNGGKKFTHFTLSSSFPSAEEYLQRDGTMFYLDPKTDYYFTDEHKTSAYDEVQKPVNSTWTK